MTRREQGKWLHKKARKGVHAYPIGTVAFYGPDDRRANKVAAAVIEREGEKPAELRRWTSNVNDLRKDGEVLTEIAEFLKAHDVRSVGMLDRIIGCPHEEGIDYPEGEDCPVCPFWAGRDPWSSLPTS